MLMSNFNEKFFLGKLWGEIYLDKRKCMMKTTTITSFIFYIVNGRFSHMQ